MMKKEINNSDRTKHIDIVFHYTREQIKNKLVEVKWIPTAENHPKFCRELNLAVVRNSGQPGKTLIEQL